MKTNTKISSVCLVVLAGLSGGCSAGVGSEDDSVSDTALENAAVDTAEQLLPPEVGAPGEGRDVTGLTVLGPTWTEAPLAKHGGNGGGFTGHVTPAAVIYGVRTRSGNLVDAIRFGWYVPSGSDNLFRTGDAWGWTPWYGGSGGGLNAEWQCPAGKGVIGLRGNSGTIVDRIGVICGDANNPNPTSPFNTYSPLWGGGGGGWFGEDKCTLGRLVDSFNVRSGTLLDSIQAICIDAH